MSWWSLVPIVGGAIERWQQGKAAVESNRHAQEMAALSQFSAEFGHGRNWFDSLIDGLNRLPRPLMVFGMLWYFALSWRDPEQFSIITTGLSLIPEPMWYLAGIMITFYFGARELAHTRKAKSFGEAAKAAVDVVTSRVKPSEWLADRFPDVQIKDGVVIDGLDVNRMAPVITAARNLYHSRGVPLVITSALDGKHMKGSKHYTGMALDFRTRTLDDPQALTVSLRAALGDDYDVVLEKDHLHVEYDPESFLGKVLRG